MKASEATSHCNNSIRSDEGVNEADSFISDNKDIFVVLKTSSWLKYY